MDAAQRWFYQNVVLPINRGEQSVVDFLDGLGPDVGSNLRSAGSAVAEFSPVQDMVDVYKGSVDLADGFLGANTDKIIAGGAGIAGGVNISLVNVIGSSFGSGSVSAPSNDLS